MYGADCTQSNKKKLKKTQKKKPQKTKEQNEQTNKPELKFELLPRRQSL